MLLKTVLEQVIENQRLNLIRKDKGLGRDALELLPDLSSHALIISGIRRCGKSTVLFQLLEQKYADGFFLNFEDPRLYEFGIQDFDRLSNIIEESGKEVLLFDEIQIVPQWERYIRQKLDEQYKVVLTGSNASLLSKELGTKLTGRHITKELYPFSYSEFCRFNKQPLSSQSLLDYMNMGGFPEFVKTREEEILNQLFDDILMRDIVVRYGIRNIKSLQRLALQLISNIGKPISASKLTDLLEIRSISTVLEYLSHLQSAYLFFLLPKFSYSFKKQQVNPRKVYAIDTGLVSVNSVSFSEDIGRKFENLVFLYLRRLYKDIYYFSEKGECDFIVFHRGRIKDAIQVCSHLTPDNIDRELNGLFKAIDYFGISEGTLVALEEHETIKRGGKTVKVVPAHEFMRP